MRITSDKIKSQLTPNCQKLMNDLLAKSDDNYKLYFADEHEHIREFHRGLGFGVNAGFKLDIENKQFFIFLKQISRISDKEDLEIAHELGHIWLFLCNFPSTKRATDENKQEIYDNCFGLLKNIMEHFIIYTYILNNYKINLYEVGNSRLIDFIKNQLPDLNNTSNAESLLLTFYYIKHTVESNDQHWQGIMRENYSEKAPDSLKIAEDSLLPIVRELVNEPTPEIFTTKYHTAMEALEDNFNIPRNNRPEIVYP